MVTYLGRPAFCPPLLHGGLFFARAGFEIKAVCTRTENLKEKKEVVAPRFEAERVALLSRRIFYSAFGGPPKNVVAASAQYFFSYIEYTIRALWTALRSAADLYEAHDLPALVPAVLAAKIRSKPIVYHAHELYSEMHEKVRFARFWRTVERTFVPFADAVVTPEENRSRIFLDEFRARELPLTVRNCPPYRAPVATARLREELAAGGKGDMKTIVLYQGILESSRCIEEIVQSAQSFDPGVCLVLLGHGFGTWTDPQSRIRGAANIYYVKYVPYETLFSYTASAQIGLLFYRNTCRNNYYCAPNKLYEYMMMGLPIITCNYPGLRKIVEDEQVGICVDPEKPAEIAAAVNTLSGDSALYGAMKENCLRLSRDKYNWENEFLKLQERYSPLLASRRRDGAPAIAQAPGF